MTVNYPDCDTVLGAVSEDAAIPDAMPDWVQALIDSHAELAQTVADLRAEQTQVIALLEQIKEQVEPTLTALMNSPVFKMMKGF